MKSSPLPRMSSLALVLALLLPAADFRQALPGYRFEFPRDHFNHPEFQTEWWYYTGNLKTSEGRRFGFELTFFRRGIRRPPENASVWDVNDVYLAHLAVSDIEAGRFHHAERLNRAGGGLAGVSATKELIWNGNWQVKWDGSKQWLHAVTEDFSLELDLAAVKPPVVHGTEGISRKAEGEGNASHYISLPRLTARGRLQLSGEHFELAGTVWMDHEFFTNSPADNQSGWDWLGIQLEDNTELMLYRLRRKDGTVEPASSGTWVDAKGQAHPLRLADFELVPGRTWKSPVTGAVYPIEWRVRVPKLRLDLVVTTPLDDQELRSKSEITPTYWEGAIDVQGTREGKPAAGAGYLELTGYGQPVRF